MTPSIIVSQLSGETTPTTSYYRLRNDRMARFGFAVVALLAIVALLACRINAEDPYAYDDEYEYEESEFDELDDSEYGEATAEFTSRF